MDREGEDEGEWKGKDEIYDCSLNLVMGKACFSD